MNPQHGPSSSVSMRENSVDLGSRKRCDGSTVSFEISASDVLSGEHSGDMWDRHGLGCEVPSWAMAWDVFNERYGERFRGGVDMHDWNVFELDCRVSSPRRGDDATLLVGEHTSEMAEALELSLASLSNPWMTPKHTHGDVNKEGSKPRLLFQYKPYEEQERLVLSDDEMAATMEAVFGQGLFSYFKESDNVQVELKEAKDAGVVILVKLVLDLYLDNGPEVAFPLVMSMFEKPLKHDRSAQCAVFDVLINLMIHGELLYSEGDHRRKECGNGWVDKEDVPDENKNVAEWPVVSDQMNGRYTVKGECDIRMEQFREFLRRLLCSLAAQLALHESSTSAVLDDSGSEVWASVLSCMTSLCTHDGYIVKEYVHHFPMSALRRMLYVARHAFWSTRIQSMLAVMVSNLVYKNVVKEDGIHSVLDFEKIEAFGGIHSIAKEYHYAATAISCQSLFCVLLDFVLTKKDDAPQKNTELGATWKFSITDTFEVQSLAYGMLQMKAAFALREYLLLPPMKTDSLIQNELSRIVHSAIVSQTDGAEDDRIPFAFVEYCIATLKEVSSATYSIPDELGDRVMSTCEAGIFGESRSEDWKCLAKNLMAEASAKEKVVGRSWMVKLMVSAADTGIEEAWSTRKNMVPPPVPLMPSEIPGKDLFTFGDTLLSAFASSRVKNMQMGSTYRSFEGDNDVITNFALAIRQVVGAMRFRTLINAPCSNKDEQIKWSSSIVDTNRLCVSTIERAFEWIFEFSSAPTWSSAVALLADCLISTVTVRKMNAPTRINLDDVTTTAASSHDTTTVAHVHTPHRPTHNGNDNAAAKASDAATSQTAGNRKVPPLYIPSPTSTNDGEFLSPLTKMVPGAPKIAAAWRRLTTPSGARSRPGSADTEVPILAQSSAQHNSRPLSAGVMMMDSTRTNASRADSIFHKDAPGMQNQAPPSTVGHTIPRGWKPLSYKIKVKKLSEKKERMKTLMALHSDVSSFEHTIDQVESFITGISSCPIFMLELLSPQILKDIFDAMNLGTMDTLHLIEPSSRQTAVQAGKPFWDSRLAIFILLVSSFTMTEKNQYKHPLMNTQGYLHSLLRDPDVRVRHHACCFILNRFLHHDTDGYLKAMKTLVSRAQQSNDDRLLRDPESQVNKILEMRLLDMSTLYI
jgi:hypothetical protein